MPYDIFEHVHRLAAWAASRAAGTSKGTRFQVQLGKAILEESLLPAMLASPDALPEPEQMDMAHRTWRNSVIEAARCRELMFSHGVAAKLINVYLKVGLVNTVYHSHPRVAALHPPIDRELLNGLANSDSASAAQWRQFRDAAWSTYDSTTYEAVIAAIRRYLGPGVPLWAVEEAWKGHQGS